MTKEELEKEAYLFAKNSKDVQNFECGFDIAFKSYLASAEPREKRIAELEKENAELRKVAEFQQSSNMSRHFENKKLKEGLAVGSTFNKALNSMNKNLIEERDKYRNMVFDKAEQLTKAKDILRMIVYWKSDKKELLNFINKAEQFLKENSTYERIQKAKYNYTN